MGSSTKGRKAPDTDRNIAVLIQAKVQHVPNAEQIRNDRHGENDHPLERNWNRIDMPDNEEASHDHEQEQGWESDPRHVGPEIRMSAHRNLLAHKW
jgi:hypothetical protein